MPHEACVALARAPFLVLRLTNEAVLVAVVLLNARPELARRILAALAEARACRGWRVGLLLCAVLAALDRARDEEEREAEERRAREHRATLGARGAAVHAIVRAAPHELVSRGESRAKCIVEHRAAPAGAAAAL